MNKLSAAITVAAVLSTGLALDVAPAAAETRCGCPVARHHLAHHRLRRVVYYREPLAPPPDAGVYDAGPDGYAEPGWFGHGAWRGGEYYGHPDWRRGWDRGYGWAGDPQPWR